jgi:hypothetical protein
MGEAFGKRVASPLQELRGGLALGNDGFQKRVDSLLRKKAGGEELKWLARAERRNARSMAAGTLAARQPERPWQVWVRVHLGGERRIDIARAYGYKDGSAITQNAQKAATRGGIKAGHGRANVPSKPKSRGRFFPRRRRSD